MAETETGADTLVPPKPEENPNRPAIASEPKGNPVQAVVLLVIGMLLIGGTVFAAYMGWVNVPFLFQPPTLEEVATSMESVDSARIGVDLGIDIGQRDPAVRSISLFDVLGAEPGDSDAEDKIMLLTEALLMVPDEISAKISGSSDWDRTADTIEGSSTFGGSLDMSGLSAEFAFEMKTIGKDLFVRIDKAPPIIPYVGSIQGQWIKYGETDETAPKQVFAYKTDLEEDASGGKEYDVAGEMAVLLTGMIRSGALDTAERPKRSDDPLGRKAYRYVLSLDKAKAVETLRSVIERRRELLPNTKDFALLVDDQDRTSFVLEGSFYDVVSKNLDIVLYADRDEGMPLALSADMVVAFDEREVPEIADTQIAVSLSLTFDRINEPIDVEPPAEYVTQDEVEILTSGRSEEDQQMRDQIGNIDDLRDALKAYEKANGDYPETLDGLLGTEVRPDYVGPEDGDTFTKVVVAIPDDLYTGEPLDYSLDDDGDYRIVYMLEIPEASTYINRFDYVEGANTATPRSRSLEGLGEEEEAPADIGDLLEIDTDQDGLSDLDEMTLYGTDPYVADTDGDGYGDGVEAEGGYDPLTNAQTGVTVEGPF